MCTWPFGVSVSLSVNRVFFSKLSSSWTLSLFLCSLCSRLRRLCLTRTLRVLRSSCLFLLPSSTAWYFSSPLSPAAFPSFPFCSSALLLDIILSSLIYLCWAEISTLYFGWWSCINRSVPKCVIWDVKLLNCPCTAILCWWVLFLFSLLIYLFCVFFIAFILYFFILYFIFT